MKMFNRKGQSTLEYALIIAVVVGGLLVMQHYVKRGYVGRLKSASDEMGEQYDPNAYTGNFTINQSSNVEQTLNAGETMSRHLKDQTNKRTGTESLNAWSANLNVYGE
jgi:uncharacterized protein (UPF0333 family)